MWTVLPFRLVSCVPEVTDSVLLLVSQPHVMDERFKGVPPYANGSAWSIADSEGMELPAFAQPANMARAAGQDGGYFVRSQILFSHFCPLCVYWLPCQFFDAHRNGGARTPLLHHPPGRTQRPQVSLYHGLCFLRPIQPPLHLTVCRSISARIPPRDVRVMPHSKRPQWTARRSVRPIGRTVAHILAVIVAAYVNTIFSDRFTRSHGYPVG